MYKKLVPLFSVWMVVSLACNLVTSTPNSGAASDDGTLTPSPAAAAGPTEQAQGISAESPGPQSVLIQWEPIAGAVEYLLEIQVGDEFLPIAVLPAGRTSYQDDHVLPATRFTYRLSSLVKQEKQDSKVITVETQPAPVDPLTVAVEFDVAPPLFEIDPENFDPGTLDPNNLDMADFMPQPVEAEAEIGPAGGEISVMGSSGMVYTLVVPPNALRMQVAIKLKPIAAISNLPLSGGLMAGVYIEPDSIVFDIPAQIMMTPPADFSPPAAPLVLAFSFDADGQEFHLYPFKTDGGQSRVGRTVASLQWVPNFNSPLTQIADAFYGGGYGQGSGTLGDVNQIVSKGPAKSQNRTDQQAAVNQLDDLTPLSTFDNDLTPLLSKQEYASAKLAESILQKAGKANDWAQFMEVMEDFRTFLNSGSDKYLQKNSVRIFEQLAAKAQALLKKNQGDCLTYDDYAAQDLVERLSNPKDKYSKILAETFKAKYGQKLLDDLANGVKACKYELAMKSKLTFKTEDSLLTLHADFSPLELFLIFSKGEIYFWGGARMKLSDQVSGACSYPLNHYPNLTFMVEKLVPVFDNGVLTDFVLRRYAVKGWQKNVSISSREGKNNCPEVISLSGGGDFWTGLFVLARMDDSILGWKISNQLKQGSRLTATWKNSYPSFAPIGAQGGTATEVTTFELKVTKNKK